MQERARRARRPGALLAVAVAVAALVLVGILGRQGAPAPLPSRTTSASPAVPEPLAAVLAHRPALLLPRWRTAVEVAASDQLDAASPLVAIGLEPGDRLVLVARCAPGAGRLVGAVEARSAIDGPAVRSACGGLLQQSMPGVEGDQLSVLAGTTSGAEWSGVLLRLPRR